MIERRGKLFQKDKMIYVMNLRKAFTLIDCCGIANLIRLKNNYLRHPNIFAHLHLSY